MNLNFKEYGKGKTIVILHGLLGSLDNWSSISLGNSYKQWSPIPHWNGAERQ